SLLLEDIIGIADSNESVGLPHAIQGEIPGSSILEVTSLSHPVECSRAREFYVEMVHIDLGMLGFELFHVRYDSVGVLGVVWWYVSANMSKNIGTGEGIGQRQGIQMGPAGL